MESPDLVIDQSGSPDSWIFDRVTVEQARLYYRTSGFQPSFEEAVAIDGGGKPLRANPLWAACVSRLSVWDLLLGMSSNAHPHRRLAVALGLPVSYVLGFLDAWRGMTGGAPPVDVPPTFELGLADGRACREAFLAEV